MSPFTKIILLIVLVGFLSAVATVVFFYLFLFEAVGFTFGSGLFENPLIDGPLIIIGFFGAWLSLLICPIVAFCFRETVLKATPDFRMRVIFFAVFCTASLPFLGLGYVGLRLYEEYDGRAASKNQSNVKKLLTRPLDKYQTKITVGKDSRECPT